MLNRSVQLLNWLREPFGVPTWTIMALVVLSLSVGAVIPMFGDSMGYQFGRLAALPALLLLGVLLIYDYKKLVMLILLFRSVGDMVLESTQFGIGSVRMGIGGLINLFVIIIACMMVMEKPKAFPGRLARYWLPFVLMMSVGLVLSYEKTNALKMYLGIVSNFAIFLIAIYTVRSNEDFNKAIRLVMYSSLLPTLYAVVDIALHMRGGDFRLQSTFSHPNVLAFYLTLVLVLGLYMLKSPLYNITPRGRIAVCLYMPMLMVQLLLTQTRSAWLACFLVFVLYALIFKRSYLLYLLLLPLLLFVPSVNERLMDLGQGNEVVRNAQLNSFAWRVDFLVTDKCAVHAHREAGARRQVQHVAHAQQALGAHLVQDGAAVDLAAHLEAQTGGDVGLDQAGDHVHAGALGGQDQVDARRTGLLGQAGNQLFDFLAHHHHQVGQLVDHHH